MHTNVRFDVGMKYATPPAYTPLSIIKSLIFDGNTAFGIFYKKFHLMHDKDLQLFAVTTLLSTALAALMIFVRR